MKLICAYSGNATHLRRLLAIAEEVRGPKRSKEEQFLDWLLGKGEYPFFKEKEKPYIPPVENHA